MEVLTGVTLPHPIAPPHPLPLGSNRCHRLRPDAWLVQLFDYFYSIYESLPCIGSDRGDGFKKMYTIIRVYYDVKDVFSVVIQP